MKSFILLVVTAVTIGVDAYFENRPSLYTYIPKYHQNAITIWSEIHATQYIYYEGLGLVSCDRCAITVEGNSGVCLIGMDIVVSPCLKDNFAQCANKALTRVDVSCWITDFGGDESTTIYIRHEDNCGKPTQEGYIFETDPTMEYDSLVGVLSCDVGYTGLPSVDTIYCNDDDSWDVVTGCEKIGCGPPTMAGYIFDEYTDTSPGSFIDVLSCDTQFSGSPAVYQIYCQDNNTWSDVSGCNAMEKGCECLSFPNGDVDFLNGTGYGAVANVTCRDGYQLSGNSLITCLDTEHWKSAAKCEPIDCGSDQFVANGWIDADPPTTYGSTSWAECEHGFDVNGDNILYCLADGFWSNFTCEPVDCRTYMKMDILNGQVNFTDAKTTFGSVLPVVCDTGYELRCGSSIECRSYWFDFGYWSTDARCTKPNITGCLDYKDIIHGEVDFTQGNTTVGSILPITCERGYALQGGFSVECMPDGCWYTNATCVIGCGTYMDMYISNGQVNFTNASTTFGSVLPVVCDTGYELRCGSSIECRSYWFDYGYWSTDARCTKLNITECSYYMDIIHGELDLTHGNITVGSIIPIKCERGYALQGGYSAECMPDGCWYTNATCVKDEVWSSTGSTSTFWMTNSLSVPETTTASWLPTTDTLSTSTYEPPTTTTTDVSSATATTTPNKTTTTTPSITRLTTPSLSAKSPTAEETKAATSTSLSDTTQNKCPKCCQWPLTTDSTDPSKCRVPHFPYGEATGDSYLAKELDGCGPVISSPIDIPIYGIPHKKWTVCTNGYVTFDTPFYEWFPPGDISDISNRTLLAPYFADVDIRGEYGEVYYQAYTSFSNSNGSPRVSSGGRVLQLAEEYVRTLMLNKDFKARFVLVATWHEAPPFPHYNAWWCWWFGWSCDDTKLATFQLALITDGVDTYLMFIYGENLMNWVQWSSLWNPDILVGYVINDGLHYSVHPYSFTTLALNISEYSGLGGIKGHWMAYLGDPGFRFENYAIKCMVWHHLVHEEQSNPWLLNECPCDLTSLRFDPWFFEVSSETSDTVCYDSWTWWLTYPNTIRCCYDKWSGGWLSSDPRAGGFLYYSPRTHPTFHQLFDNDTRRYCCDLSDNCNLYRELRPIGTCYDQSPWTLAIFFGDPHITTLDGMRYTFNGLGEYTLLDVQTVNDSFSLQGRTERLTNSEGNLTDATIFSAFAAKDNSNASVQVELSADKTEMIIYGNGIDLTNSFLDETSPFSFADPSSKPDLQMSRQNKTLSIFFMSTEIHLSIHVGTGMLIQQVTVPDKYVDLCKGLLGNNDGNPDNDFVFANGSLLAANSTERELFPFGQSWMTTPDQSVFEYPVGMSHQNFSFPDFVPMFLDDVDDELRQNATQFCGADNLECIYDMVMTGSEKAAAYTKETSLKHTETVNTLENNAPHLNGTRRIEMTYGENKFAGISGFDESALEFFITNNSAAEMIDVGSDYVNITFYTLGPITGEISVYAVDPQGKPSAPHVFEIILCTGCNQHGTCNFTQYKDGTRQTDPVKYAMCNCDGDGNSNYWTGEDCEEDYNGCLAEPCASGQTCTDVNAILHQQNGTAFECSACPFGYELNDTKCQAVNLCENNDHGCEQICEVTRGSFECLCETGFRRISTNLSACDDINECEESQHICQHRCNNTDGSYSCDCYAGYSLTADGYRCEAEYDACSDSTLDCSATAGCTNETGTAACFCNSGFELGNDGLTCRDKNECQGNVCSQVCTNTIGSFVCSCLPGYQLQGDQSTCAACDKVHWGENCQGICDCGPGSSPCDRVHGCMCDSGWSGDTCSEDVDECLNTNVCGDINKVCYNTMGSFYCYCREGFAEGLDGMCEDINECEDLALNSCEHTCNNVLGSFTCSCRAGYETDSTDPQKCQDLDECLTGISKCEQNCKNVPGSYNCYCYYGYILNNDRRTCSVVQDFCSVTGALNCSDICGVENEEPVCYCPLGYHLAPDKLTCVDIDECADPLKNQCSHPDTCYNYNGGYECSCPVGYRLQNDGRTCVVCDAYHHGENCEMPCNCLLGSDKCHPIAGCICLDGWTGDHCGEDKNECDAEENPCTGDNMDCVNTLGSFNCSCKEGYEMVGDVCNDADECSDVRLNNCDQTCTNTLGSFACHCADGFILSNGQCEDIDECSGLNDCQQLCINTLGGYRCQCEAGYRLDITDGRSCIAETECPEQNKTDCAALNADCVVFNGEAVCNCLKGFENVSGICTDIKECDRTPCDYICIEDEGSYHCICQLGYKLGPDHAICQICDEGTWGVECNQTCNCNSETTASCSPGTGVCTCEPGWEGTTCADDVNECLGGSASCSENSQCININGSFVCKCDTGFTKTSSGNCTECEYGKWGDNCAQECQCSLDHTTKCNSVDGSCHCMDGWTSEKCSEDIDECLSQDACDETTESCLNNEGSYACTCKDGYLRNANQACEVCDVEVYGSICSSDCDCVAENTQTGTTKCDPISGFCLCLSQWTGYRCNIDVDECETGKHNCAHICNNTEGGFECECNEGFVKGSDGDCFEHTEEPSEDKSLIIGLGIGLPAAVIIIAIAVIVALYYLNGASGQITPVHLGQIATPSYKTDCNQIMIHQGKENTFGSDLYDSNLPGTSSRNDIPGFSSGNQWNGTSFGHDLPGSTFGNGEEGTTFGQDCLVTDCGHTNPQYVPDEFSMSPRTASCTNLPM